MAFENILSEREDGVATVTINRPSARNALSSATIDELNAAFSEIAGDESVRVAILRGAGDVAFCAGADLKEVATLSDIPARRRYFGGVANLLETIHRMPQPVIRPENLGLIVRETLVLQKTALPGIAWSSDIPAHGPVVPCDRRMMRQASSSDTQ